jgi:hypothetical protein
MLITREGRHHSCFSKKHLELQYLTSLKKGFRSIITLMRNLKAPSILKKKALLDDEEQSIIKMDPIQPNKIK